MSNSNTNKYWYFRFTHDFFSDSSIRNMKFAPCGLGYKWIVIYLELCSLSLETGGYIIIDKTLSEKNYVMDLARAIGEDGSETAEAMTYFIQKGLVEIVENIDATVICVSKVENNIGRSSEAADRKRLARSGATKQLLDPQAQVQLPEPDSGKTGYGFYQNVFLSEDELRVLEMKYLNINTILATLSIDKKFKNIEIDNDYAELLQRVEREGKRNLKVDPFTILKKEVKAGRPLPIEAKDILSEEEYEYLLRMSIQGD